MLACGGDDLVNFSDGQDVGQCFLFWDSQFFENVPVSWAGEGVEELDSVIGNLERAGCEVAIVDEVQEVVADLLL